MSLWSSKGTVQTSSPSSVDTVMSPPRLCRDSGEVWCPWHCLPWCNVHCSSSNRTHHNHYWSGQCTSIGWLPHPVCIWRSGQPHQEQCCPVLLYFSWSVHVLHTKHSSWCIHMSSLCHASTTGSVQPYKYAMLTNIRIYTILLYILCLHLPKVVSVSVSMHVCLWWHT